MSAYTPTTQISRDQLNQLVSAGWEFLPTNIPITYRPDWNMFHAIREFVQNSLDEVGDFNIELTSQGLQISDNGPGVQMVDFLMRYREKPAWARGQFGEGLKIACLVCLRNGYPLEVLTVNTLIRPVMVPIMLQQREIPVLHFVFHSFPQKTSGTTVTIVGYRGELYKDKFVQKLPGDVVVWIHKDMIAGHEVTEQVLDYPKNVERKWLYVRDIYVRDFDKPSLFSYNLWHVQLDPDRVGLKFPREVTDGVAGLWAEDVPKTAIKRLLEVAKITMEQRILPEARILELSEDVVIYPDWNYKKTWKEAFYEIYPADTVLWTNHEEASLATHLGKKVVELPTGITQTLQRCGVKTDHQLAQELALAKRKPIDPAELAKREQLYLGLCWWLEKKLRVMYAERAVVDPLEKIVVYTELPQGGEYTSPPSEIRIRRSEMQTEHGAVETFVHEYAHHASEGAADYSPEYENARDFLTYLVWILKERPTGWELYDILKAKGVEPKFTPKRPRREIKPTVEIQRGMWVRVIGGVFAGTEGRVSELRWEAATGKTLVKIARSDDPRLDIWVDKDSITEIPPPRIEAPLKIGDRVRVKGSKEYPSRSRPYEDYEGTVTGSYAGKVYVSLWKPRTTEALGIQQEYFPDDLEHVETRTSPIYQRAEVQTRASPSGSWTRTWARSDTVIDRARRNIKRLRKNVRG